MFTYKNHRVHVAGISFVIPDGCVLNWENTEVEIVGFSALTPDKKAKFDLLPCFWLPNMDNLSSYEKFQKLTTMFKDNTYTFHTDIIPIHKYGMNGCSLLYSGETIHHYEEMFDLPESMDGIYLLNIGVTAMNGTAIEEAMQHPLVQEFLDSIKKE